MTTSPELRRERRRRPKNRKEQIARVSADAFSELGYHGLSMEEIAGQARWDRLVRQLIDTALRNRTSGGLYRWEGRHLEHDDQMVLTAQIKIVNRRLQRPLSQLRPQLSSRQRWTIPSAVLSVIGSITDHRARFPADQIRTTLVRIARALRDTDLPDEESTTNLLRSPAVGAGAGDKPARRPCRQSTYPW
jgi:hypothetical protein